MFQMLMAISKLDDPIREAARNCAEQALDAAVEWKLIEPNKQALKRIGKPTPQNKVSKPLEEISESAETQDSTNVVEEVDKNVDNQTAAETEKMIGQEDQVKSQSKDLNDTTQSVDSSSQSDKGDSDKLVSQPDDKDKSQTEAIVNGATKDEIQTEARDSNQSNEGSQPPDVTERLKPNQSDDGKSDSAEKSDKTEKGSTEKSVSGESNKSEPLEEEPLDPKEEKKQKFLDLKFK